MDGLVDALRFSWRFNLDQVESLLNDVPADRMTDQSGGVVNHPAWTLHHLNHYHPAILSLIHNQPVDDPARHPDAPRYDEGSVPVNDPAAYLAQAELLAAYRDGHQRVANALAAMEAAHLALPPQLPRWASAFGTTGRVLQYLMVIHESHHIGQIMAWRRAAGLSR